jgi:hypothetical protein
LIELPAAAPSILLAAPRDTQPLIDKTPDEEMDIEIEEYEESETKAKPVTVWRSLFGEK